MNNLFTRADTPSKACPSGYWSLHRWRQSMAKAPLKQHPKLIAEAVTELNQRQCSVSRRHWLLTQIHDQAQPVLDRLHRRITQQSPTGPTHRVIEYYLRLLDLFVSGYTTVAEQECKQSRPQPRRIAGPSQMALALRGQQLLAYAQSYLPVPAGFWRDFHQQFRLADDRGLAEYAPRRRFGQQQVTVGTEYRRVCAFSVAPTDNLPKNQTARVYEALGSWLRDEPFAVQRSQVPKDSLVVSVNTVSDEAPTLQDPSTETDLSADDWRLFSVRPILDGLDTCIPGSNTNDEGPLAEHERLQSLTIDRLRTRFEANPGRGQRRYPRHSEVEVHCGLADIHGALSYVVAEDEDQDAATKWRTPPDWTIDGSDKGQEAVSEGFVTHPLSNRYAEMAQLWDAVSHGRPSPMTARQQQAQTLRGKHAKTYLQVVDESAEGLRLTSHTTTMTHAHVGQLLALRPTTTAAGSDWQLAVVRRLRYGSEERIDLGATKLPGTPNPAMVRREPEDPNRKRHFAQEPTEPAILLPRREGKGGETTLLLPAYMFRQGEVVEVDIADRTLRVALAAILDSSTSFAQFTLAEPPPVKQRQARQEQFDLDGIWGSWSGRQEEL